ncbi:MAG: LamG-like jellyroll fold domain-containing protein [Treponemataceae bacterium]
MYKKQLFIFFVICLVSLWNLNASDVAAKTFGGKNGWRMLAIEEGVQRGKGKYGYESIELATDATKVNDSLDLLLSFENGQIVDETGNYHIISSAVTTTGGLAAMGKSSGLSRGLQSGLKLKGTQGSLFGTRGLTGSFTLEFWLKPSIAESGEKIFNWRSSKVIKNNPLYQVIQASFVNNKLEWIFSNVFFGQDYQENWIELRSHSSIIPEKWSHHVLTYDDNSGLIEYRINGKTEAVTYATSTLRQDGSVYPAELGGVNEIEICQRYTGLIDDFAIFRGVHKDRMRDFYNQQGGRIETKPIETTTFGSKALSLNAVLDKPPQTEVQFFIRGGENFYEWTASYPEWTPIKLNEPIKNISGMFFQIAADLYPDGSGNKTPSISEIVISYEEEKPPLPPSVFRAEAGSGYVDLSWSKSIDDNVDGYVIYYGERPGEYLGQLAHEGNSPLFVGNQLSFRLNGLRNGKIYYFAIAAYSSKKQRLMGVLSKEIFARPLRSGS